jgi:hypothetical protein
MRGFFPLCHCFLSFWHYGIAGQHMTTAIGGGSLSLNRNVQGESVYFFSHRDHREYRGEEREKGCTQSLFSVISVSSVVFYIILLQSKRMWVLHLRFPIRF